MLGVLRSKMVCCGKKGCRCRTDPAFRHGPYWYLYWRQGKRVRCKYIPAQAVEAVQQAVAARQNLNGAIQQAHADMAKMRWQLARIKAQLEGVMLEGRAIGEDELQFTTP